MDSFKQFGFLMFLKLIAFWSFIYFAFFSGDNNLLESLINLINSFANHLK